MFEWVKSVINVETAANISTKGTIAYSGGAAVANSQGWLSHINDNAGFYSVLIALIGLGISTALNFWAKREQVKSYRNSNDS